MPRLADIFGEHGDQNDAKEYLAQIRTQLTEDLSRISRVIVMFLTLAGLFELLARGAIQEGSIQGMKLSDLSAIRKIIPTIVAFLYYDLMSLLIRSTLMGRLHRRLIDLIYPRVADNQLDWYIEPRRPALMADYSPASGHVPAFINTAFFAQGLVISLIGSLGIPAFEFYAYFLQFKNFDGYRDALTLASLFITVFFVSAAWISVARAAFANRDDFS